MYLVESKADVPPGLVEQSRAPVPEPMEPDPDSDSRVARYYELRDRSIRERDAGNLADVLQLCEEALALANEIGNQALMDQAYCNWFGIALAMEREDLSLSELRKILMRSRSPRTSFTAAYHMACGYTTRKQHKKALFYAQVARDRACALNNAELIATSHNELGRCYLSESYFEKAVAECKKAIEVLPRELSVTHTAPLGNLGYTEFLLGNYRAGFKYLYRSLRRCRANVSERVHQEWIHLYLCFGHTELRRWRYAWHHGCSALELAEANGNKDAVKSALYLLGEVEKSAGDIEAAHEYFSRLQREFYPENKELAKVMLFFETRDLVNLRA